MKKMSLWIALLAVVAGVADGQEVALWKEKLPGFRKPYDVALLPDNIFALKADTGGDTEGEASAKAKAEADKVAALKVTGLVWSNDRESRRVLMADLVMREGQAIPSYVFNDGRYYVLVEILKDRLRFRSQGEDLANAFTFEVPFGLKNAIRNQSDFSAQKDEK